MRGIFSAADIDAAIGVPHPFFPQTIAAPPRLLCLENTHNIGGGSIWPLEALSAVVDAGRRRRLAVDLDGARLWHATVVTGIAEAEYAKYFDSVSVCFSKALGAPIGSCLAGPRDFIARARRFKQQIGGGFRQAGIIAAGALHALDHHRSRLGEVHALAARFAQGLAQIEGIAIDPATVETNIVRYRLKEISAGGFVEEAHRRGLWMLPSGPDAVRAVFYLDIHASGRRYGAEHYSRNFASASEVEFHREERIRRICKLVLSWVGSVTRKRCSGSFLPPQTYPWKDRSTPSSRLLHR